MLSPTFTRRLSRCAACVGARTTRSSKSKALSSGSPTRTSGKNSLGLDVASNVTSESNLHSLRISRPLLTSFEDINSNSTVLWSSTNLNLSINAIVRAAEGDGQWRYARDQLKPLLLHSERVAPWQQHASLLLRCAEIALTLGEAAEACELALDAVDLHVAVCCDATSVVTRLIAAKALDKSGRKTESSEMYRSACAIIEKGVAAHEQTIPAGKPTKELDAALPFVEYANFLENCDEDLCTRANLLKKALKQSPTTKSTISVAHLSLARIAVAESDMNEADSQYERAVQSASADSQMSEILAEAALFAQHKLRSIEKAVGFYNRLFDLRPPSATTANPTVGELLLNAGVCFELHPDHGSSRAVGLFRAALDHFPPKSPNVHRLRLYLARAYAGSGQIDRAMEEYSCLIQQMSGSTDDPIQIDVNNVRGVLPLCEVHGHLGLCLFQRVGDLMGAATQYQSAFESATSKKIPSRTMEWLHEGAGALFLRLGQHAEAIRHLEEKIDLASRRNDPAIDAHLHAAAAYEALQKPECALEIYKYLFDLPTTASSRESRLELTLRFAWLCHYTLADYNAAVTLYLAALHIDADNPHTMVQAAWCMLQLPQHDVAEVEALYVSASLAVETAKHASATPMWDECYVLGECAVFHHDVTKKTSLAEELYKAALVAKTSDNFAQVAANFAVFLHYEKKETERAMSWFEAAIAANPNLPAAITLFADFLIHTNQLERAVDELLKLLPTHRTEAWHKLGRIAERVAADETYDTAVASYCRALGAPDEAGANEPLSDDQVLRYCDACDSAHLGVMNDLVMLLHYKTRRTRLVDQLYGMLVQRFPEEVHLLMHFARFSVDILKRRKKAHALFRRAVKLDPTNVTVLDHYAEFLSTTFPDRLDAAEAIHLQSIRTNPASAQAHFSYASFLTYVFKAPARAELHFKTALNIDPTDSLTLCCYATFLESQAEQRDKNWKFYAQSLSCAEWMHREAVRQNPNNASHSVFLANFLWRQRRHAEVWAPLQQALRLEPGNVVTLRLTAMFLHDWISTNASLGVVSETMDQSTMIGVAEALFKRCLALAPNDVTTLRGFAKFLEDIKRDHAAAASVDSFATELELAEHDAAMTADPDDDSENV